MTIEEAAEHYASVTDPEAHGIDFMREVFIAGAEWYREQMINEAVEISYKGGTARINGQEKPFEGGKVRVIIVKEDE